MGGALHGLKIVEMAGVGPGPFAGMMLADHGAEVIRVERPGERRPGGADILTRSRRSILVDLKHPDGIAVVRDLCARADGLIEGYRPGVMERLGLGPDLLLGDNPKLVYGRMTGWGQTGPWADRAGHDINYIAVAGNLHVYGPAGGKPAHPVNAVGDFGGGGMLLAFGMLAGLLNVRGGGAGQVIDCAMVDGAALLHSMIWSFHAQGWWRDERGVNLLDGGAHFYDSYETADGKYLAVGAIEPQFYAELRRIAGLADDPAFDAQHEREGWPVLKETLAALFRTKARDDWCALFEGSDACVAPVLAMGEAPDHPHNRARGGFVEVGGVTQPAPAPRYSETPADAPRAPIADGAAILAELGYPGDRIAALIASGVVGGA